MSSSSSTRHLSIASAKEDLLALQRAGKTLRIQSPVIRQWPWDNGVPLEEGSLVVAMKEKMSSAVQGENFVDMALVSLRLTHHVVTKSDNEHPEICICHGQLRPGGFLPTCRS